MTTATTMATSRRSMLDRMKNAARLDTRTYDEVVADSSATPQAAAVVGIVALAQGIGSAGLGVQAIAIGIMGALVGWLVWSGVTYLIGDKILGGTATWGQLLRAIGFAQSPGVFAVFAIVPVLGGLVRLVIAIWVLVAGIIAIRQALAFSTGKAILTAVLGWLALAIPMALLAGIRAG